MINKKRCDEIQTKLNEVQKGCTTRVYSIEEVNMQLITITFKKMALLKILKSAVN